MTLDEMFKAIYENRPDDWKGPVAWPPPSEFYVARDLALDLGEDATAETIEWMIKEDKRPYRNKTGKFYFVASNDRNETSFPSELPTSLFGNYLKSGEYKDSPFEVIEALSRELRKEGLL